MSDLMKLIGDYAEQRVASSLLVQDRDADAAESFAIEDRLVCEITDTHAAEIRRAKAEALREFADSLDLESIADEWQGPDGSGHWSAGNAASTVQIAAWAAAVRFEAVS